MSKGVNYIPTKKRNEKKRKENITCICCGEKKNDLEFWTSRSKLYEGIGGRLVICKDCLYDIYNGYIEKYKKEYEALEYKFEIEDDHYFERQAMRRICMILDVYYADRVFDSVLNAKNCVNILGTYFRNINLGQNKDKTFDNTIAEDTQKVVVMPLPDTFKIAEITKKTKKFFGLGFTDEDYMFLQKEYDDWTSRHECETKAQEEIFKDIAFNRLFKLKALREDKPTKDLDAAFQNLLDSGNLKPKQAKTTNLDDKQSFGLILDKCEMTRPLPEIDEDLRDVDGIGLYVDAFVRGHTCKMLNVKNAFSRVYTKVMEKFTVKKPEYSSDEDSEVLFDAVFGTNENIDKL